MPTVTMRLSATKLRSLLCARGLAQEELANMLHCSERQIRNWIRRDTDIHISYLYSLAEILGVDMDDLLVSVPIPC